VSALQRRGKKGKAISVSVGRSEKEEQVEGDLYQQQQRENHPFRKEKEES